MTDIFFSYSSKDRERVRPVRDALAAQGFDVFWDQEVPTGLDWDRWIRDHLNKSKCALVFWSVNSIASDNVRHEATVAKQHGKLVPVMLDALTAEQFPMGLYAVQGANLGAWTGGDDDAGWIELRRQIETKLTPLWVRRTIDTLEAELVAERARRDAAERRDRTLRDQIAKEAQAQQELRRERDHALEEIDALNVRLEAAVRAGQGATAAEAERIAELERRISELEQARDAARAEATAMQKRAARAEARSAELEDNLRSAFASVEQQEPSAAPPSRAPPAAGATPSPMRLDPKPLAAAADRWPVALAFAFVVAVWAFMLGFANTQARPGLIAAGTVLLAIAALQVLRRRAVLGGSEIALYWLGCGIAMALSAFTLVDRHAGALIASLIALTSAAAIVARWRKGRLGGVEIALYWLGCSVAAATATVILIEWAGAEGFAVGPAGGFWGAAMTVLFALIIIYRRRAVLEGTEVALYWAGCSVALFVAAAALMIPMFAWTGSSLILIAPLIALVSAAVLIRRRRTRLGGIELFIYWLGCAIATAGLIAPAFYALGFGVGPGLLVALAAGVVSGVIIVVRRRSAARKAKADPQPHSLSY